MVAVPNPRRNPEFADLDDDELRARILAYRRDLALLADEVADPLLYQNAHQFLKLRLADAEAEERRRQRAARLGVPRAGRRIPDEVLAELRRRISLRGAVEAETGVRLRPAGKGRWRGPCPLHGGDNPSAFAIYADETGEGHFCCYSCGASGDVIALTQAIYGVGFRQAVDLLATRVALAGRP